MMPSTPKASAVAEQAADVVRIADAFEREQPRGAEQRTASAGIGGRPACQRQTAAMEIVPGDAFDERRLADQNRRVGPRLEEIAHRVRRRGRDQHGLDLEAPVLQQPPDDEPPLDDKQAAAREEPPDPRRRDTAPAVHPTGRQS